MAAGVGRAGAASGLRARPRRTGARSLGSGSHPLPGHVSPAGEVPPPAGHCARPRRDLRRSWTWASTQRTGSPASPRPSSGWGRGGSSTSSTPPTNTFTGWVVRVLRLGRALAHPGCSWRRTCCRLWLLLRQLCTCARTSSRVCTQLGDAPAACSGCSAPLRSQPWRRACCPYLGCTRSCAGSPVYGCLAVALADSPRAFGVLEAAVSCLLADACLPPGP